MPVIKKEENKIKCSDLIIDYLIEGQWDEGEIKEFKKDKIFFLIENTEFGDEKDYPYAIIDNNNNIFDLVNEDLFNKFKQIG